MNRSSFRLCAMLLSVLLFVPTAALPANRALVLSISDYSLNPLPGATKDIENGCAIAKLLGVPAENIVVRHDKQLAGNGIIQALEDFAKLVQKGDRVFIYYSGHGSSYSRKGKPGVCEKALVSQDIHFLPKEEINKQLTALATRAEKTFAFFDCCYSGGMVPDKLARGWFRANTQSALRPKFIATSNSDPCSRPVNRKNTRDYEISEVQKQPNYYLLASAAANEVALDGGKDVGGLASSAVLDCLQHPGNAGGASGGVATMEDVRRCAQVKVDDRLAAAQKDNSNFPYTSMTLTAGYGEGGNPPVAFNVEENTEVNTPAFLKSLYEGRDATRKVELTANANPIRIGQELTLTATSDHPGYLTLLAVGSSGKIFEIFPNKMDKESHIEAGTPVAVPRPGKWRLPAVPPAGENWILALVSDTPDRFSDLGKQTGAFTNLGNTGKTTRGFFDFLFKPEDDCARGGRDFSSQSVDKCSKAYGAALLRVMEVE